MLSPVGKMMDLNIIFPTGNNTGVDEFGFPLRVIGAPVRVLNNRGLALLSVEPLLFSSLYVLLVT